MPLPLIQFLRPARRFDAPLLRSVIRRHPRLSGTPAADQTPETTMLKTALAAAAAVALVSTAAAQAGEPATVSQSVAYAPHAQAAEAFLARLDAAAGRVCEPQRKGQKGLEADAAFRACRTATVQRAVTQLGDPEVARLLRQPVRVQTAVAAR
jgi:UrcA family protein